MKTTVVIVEASAEIRKAAGLIVSKTVKEYLKKMIKEGWYN